MISHRPSLHFLLSVATMVATWAGSAGMTLATPANKKALENHFEHFLPQRLDDCTTCHRPSENHSPHSLEEFPHNPFGDRLRKLGVELKARKADASLGSRLQLVAGEDSDGDGIDNLTEILLGTGPGDAADKPAAAAMNTDAASKRDAFTAFLKRYAWQPFQPVRRPVVPAIRGETVRNPIDAFIAEQRQSRGLKPRPEADRATLLRRVYLDLIGLAPTPDEVDAFVTDKSPLAYEQIVDRLLDDPRYGERWGRHFLDIWRYSDWDGYKEMVRISQPHVWRWRDWTIESLNAGKPYDRMVQEMLAADELAPDDLNALRATGFLVRNYNADRFQWMDMVVEHTSKAFMGLTMNCVKCHDHKYDPLPQEDYYRIRAVFEPYNVRTDPVPGELDTAKDGLARAYDQSLKPVTYVFQRGDERFPIKDKVIDPGAPGIFHSELEVRPVSLPMTARQPERRDFVRKEVREKALRDLDAARAACEAAKLKSGETEETALRLQVAEAKYKALLELLPLEEREDRGLDRKSGEWQGLARRTSAAQIEADYLEAKLNKMTAAAALEKAEVAEKAAKDAASKTKAGKAIADAKKKADAAAKALAAAEKARREGPKAEFKPRIAKSYPDTSTGRRLAFARWLTSPENTLFDRVAMNHLWLRHFGAGIVATPADFGANGKKPTHPALLDWLAAEFRAQGCRLKPLHRLVVTSATYRMASSSDEADLRIDPDNLWMWRAPTRRMEGEIVRDNLLNIAGLLDPEMGGPDIDNAQGESCRRRALYLRHAQEKLVEFIQIFDGASVTECYQRERSIKPHQALALMNGPLTEEAGAALEKQLSATTGSDYDAFVQEAFRRVLGRGAKAQEMRMCEEFLDNASKGGDTTRARQRLIGVLFNHNDFVTIR